MEQQGSQQGCLSYLKATHACTQTQNQRPIMGAALQGPLVGEHLRWAQNKLGSPLEDGRMADEPRA